MATWGKPRIEAFIVEVAEQVAGVKRVENILQLKRLEEDGSKTMAERLLTTCCGSFDDHLQ